MNKITLIAFELEDMARYTGWRALGFGRGFFAIKQKTLSKQKVFFLLFLLKNNIKMPLPIVLIFNEISLSPELSRPPSFIIYKGPLSVMNGQRTEILVSNIGF